MLDTYIGEQLFQAAVREGMDLNNPNVQRKLNAKRAQVEQAVIGLVKQMTKTCGCKETTKKD